MQFFMALLDQCAVGGKLEGQFIRKRSHFQCSEELHHLHVRCPGDHQHLHLRGKGRAASSAQYTPEECERILADCKPNTHATDEAEGGRYAPTPTEGLTRVQQLQKVLGELQAVAADKQLSKQWDRIMGEWLWKSQLRLSPALNPKVQIASATSMDGKMGDQSGGKPSDRHLSDRFLGDQLGGIPFDRHRCAPAGASGDPSGGHPSDRSHTGTMPDQSVGGSSSGGNDAPMPIPPPSEPPPHPEPPGEAAHPRELKDLVKGDICGKPWQHQKYSSENALWQGVALRRRMHCRRSNVSLGVATVDLSGPH